MATNSISLEEQINTIDSRIDRNPTILILDDNEEAARSIYEIARYHGFVPAVDLPLNYEQIWLLLQAGYVNGWILGRPIDVLITDGNMDAFTGIDVATLVRERDTTNRSHLILITSNNAMIEQAPKGLFDELYQKPIPVYPVLERLKGQIERREHTI